MSVTIKFKKDLQTLKSAVNGEFYLDVKSPKLYKKIRRYYQNEGVIFSEDPLDNYDILMECIANDLETSEVAWWQKFFFNVKDTASLRKVSLNSTVCLITVCKNKTIILNAGMTFICLIIVYNALLQWKINNMRVG